MVPESFWVAPSDRREVATEWFVLVIGPAGEVVICDTGHVVDSWLAAVLVETGAELCQEERNA